MRSVAFPASNDPVSSSYARFDLVPATPATLEVPLSIHALHGTAFYGALILQVAFGSGCAVRYTEDMHVGTVIDRQVRRWVLEPSRSRQILQQFEHRCGPDGVDA